MTDTLAYQLTKFEIPKAIPIPDVAPGAISCPHCKALDFMTTHQNQKCMACGMLYRVERNDS